ncbi:MAG: hypothetical protein QUV05_21715 [Phycisphaerae bacterium]|nr:hypothetical protein [Phycisphaerae bacterium]
MNIMTALIVWAATSAGAVEARWNTAVLRLDDAARVVALEDVATGRNYALPGHPFCRIQSDSGVLVPDAVRREDDRLTFGFPGGASLTYRVVPGDGFSIWTLNQIAGIDTTRIAAIHLANLNLDGLRTVGSQINAYYDDSFAAAVMATQINVHAHPEKRGDGKGITLCADVLRRYGLMPAGFGIIAGPRKSFETTLDTFEKAAGLPNPHPGGTWSRQSPWTQRSYLFITGFGEKNADEVIAWAKRGGFDMILILGDSWSQTHGHYEINRGFFPDGLPSVQRTVARLRGAGFRVGLHFLNAAVYLNDPYVTPVPDPRLFKDARAELAADTDDQADFLPTVTSPKDFPAEDGGYTGNGTFVQIGDELIQYRELRTQPPYGLARCQRGACGTKAAAHRKGDKVEHLLRSYGYFLFDLDSTLAKEVVGNACRVANAVEADMLYFDGSERLQGDHWYYNAKLQDMYYRGLTNKNTLLQGSSYSHYSWHLISRMASADGHGDLKGYLDQRLGWLANYEANLMPMDIGWYYVYDPKVTADQFEYVLQKCLGFGASISVQTNPQQLAGHPEMGAIFDLVNAYEKLRLSRKVPQSIRRLLREPGREYRLRPGPPRLRRVVFGPWQEVRELDGKQNVWPIEPATSGARLGVQIRCGPLVRPGKAYEAPQAVVLETFDDLSPYAKNASAKQGVTQQLTSVTEDPAQGARCGKYTAGSTLADASGWCVVSKRFDPPLDLSWHKAIGLWLRGDGNGGAFKLQLRDDRHATDYYIQNDFREWRYFQLPRPTKPSPEPIDYRKVEQLMFYYNGLPAGATVNCWIDDVKALAEWDEASLVRPSLKAGTQRIEFPATLREGERLVFFPGERAETIPARAGERRQLPPAQAVQINANQTVTLQAAESLTAHVEVRLVQDCPEELPLPE